MNDIPPGFLISVVMGVVVSDGHVGHSAAGGHAEGVGHSGIWHSGQVTSGQSVGGHSSGTSQVGTSWVGQTGQEERKLTRMIALGYVAIHHIILI